MNKYQTDLYDKIMNNSIRYFNNIPIPLEIEFNLIDKCNRKCKFCPRIDSQIAPNTNLTMPKKLYENIADELKYIGFEGLIMFSGYGEPLLYKDIYNVTKTFSFANVIITTNGDYLTENNTKLLQESGAKKIYVSLYDIKNKNRLTNIANKFNKFIVIRDRYNNKEFDIINRAGTLNKEHKKQKCYYPFYMMMIDANGDVLPCCQDWNRHYKLGNLYQNTLWECWTGTMMCNLRSKLSKCNRNIGPCKFCNVNGMLRGIKNYKLFTKI